MKNIEPFLSGPLSPLWQQFFEEEASKEYFYPLLERVVYEYETQTIYPEQKQVLEAFVTTPLEDIRGVLIGQDPYHNKGQACGLSFSVSEKTAIPPSLHTIYTELSNEYEHPKPTTGNLKHWAHQGILMLNSCLTVKATQAASHKNIGWQQFTTNAIQYVNKITDACFFFLWGNFAHQFERYLDASRHKILKAAHPSPLARGAFLGCNCFIEANLFLLHHHKKPIKWFPEPL